MKTGLLDRKTFEARYPEQKPVCFNYATARKDVLALIEEIEALRFMLTQRSTGK